MRRRIALASTAALAAAVTVLLLIVQLVQPTSAAGGAASVQAGGGHSCSVTTTESLRCWGANAGGQLGDGTGVDQVLPVEAHTCEDLPDVVAGGLPPECIPLADIKAVSTGFTHTCALHETGIALCWGRNTYGQLGDATTVDRSVAVPVCASVPGAGAGGATSCCPVVPSPTPMATATRTPTGTSTPGSTPTSTATATVMPTASATPGPCAMLSGVVSLSAGNSHTCALTEDGTVWCWGENGFGQLGSGAATTSSSRPVQVCDGVTGPPPCSPLTGVAAIDAGSYHTCALMENGGARCWGNNVSGQLGNGTFTDSPLPVVVCAEDVNPAGNSVAGAPCGQLTGVGRITAGGAHSCAVMTDSRLLCWGENSSGQLGDATSFDRSAPVAPCDAGLSTAGVGGGATPACCAIVLSGSPAGDLSCSLTGVASASAGGEHTCAILVEGGALLCWGNNTEGQNGDGTMLDSALPGPVCDAETAAAGATACGAFINAASVSAGFLHTCALTGNGGVFCWGANTDGKVGDGTATGRTRPVEVSGFQGKPTATPTNTRTMTATGTLTPNQTPTTPPEVTPTATATATLVPSATPTPTRTPTAPPTSTPTSTRTPTRTPTPPGLNGDVNCDGEVTAVDAAIILQLVAALIDTVGCPNNVDVNGDSAIDPIDAALVLQYVAGLIPSL